MSALLAGLQKLRRRFVTCPDCGGQGKSVGASYSSKGIERWTNWECGTCDGTGQIYVEVLDRNKADE